MDAAQIDGYRAGQGAARRGLAWRAWLVGMLACLMLPVAAQTADPWVDWQSADSAHFRVHYRREHRAQAERVIAAAERAWPRVTASLDWQPRGRTEVVVYNEYDLPNGFTTPLPYNLMGILLSPADDGEILDHSDWIDVVVTHEFTHAVHLDKIRGAPKVLQAIFGRVPWFFPNAFAPGWTTEGLAVYHEGDAASGRGRLRTPGFEAWLRAERARGFASLDELNADGRRLPVSKQYLYGAYFYDWLARSYGKPAVTAFVERYSGNVGFIPRLHSNPLEIAGKPMDALWSDFLADLQTQVDARAEPLRRQAPVVGPARSETLFQIDAVAGLPGGEALALLDDGLGAPQLVRLDRAGRRLDARRVHFGSRISTGADGRALISQPDLCNTYYLAYDLYRYEAGRLQRLTHCAHLRRAVDVDEGIAAIQLDGGLSRLVHLDREGGQARTVWQAPAGTDLIDLAPAADGRGVVLITKRGGDWRLQSIGLGAGAAPRPLAAFPGPMHSLRASREGLEFVGARDGAFNVWRYAGGSFQRLTHTHTGITGHSGTQADGALWTVEIAPGGYALHRLEAATALQTLAASTGPTEVARAAASPLGPVREGDRVEPANPQLAEGRDYAAWRSLYPRSWLPTFVVNDRGLTWLGASTFGSDALGLHQYSLSAAWEFNQKEPLLSLEYLYLSAHAFAVQRTLSPKAWTGASGKEDTTVYERSTQAQWISLLPWLSLDHRLAFGLGAALDRIDRVDVPTDSTQRPRDERVAAALIDWDSRGANWWSEGANRGQHSTLLYETYKPFQGHGPVDYDGEVLRADLRAYLPLGRSVLALRHTEARSRGRIEPFQLGGASDPQLRYSTVLNQRDLALRGYAGDESALLGTQARVSSIEWRVPLADIDRHLMVPAVGLNRLAAGVFYEQGGAWDQGHSPRQRARSLGLELRSEVRLLYALGLDLRLGVAKGLDLERDVQGYVQLGHSF